MRALSSAVNTALGAGTVRTVIFVYLGLDDVPLYLSSSRDSITWGGHQWIGLGNLVGVGPIEETLSLEAVGYKLSLSSSYEALRAIALEDNPQGRPCSIYLGLFDDDNHLIDSPILECEGLLDQFQIVESKDSAVVSVSVENELIDLARPRGSRMTDAAQQQRYPGDRGFMYVGQMVERISVWPSKAYFQQ